MKNTTVLPRRSEYHPTVHAKCRYGYSHGRVVAVYIFVKRKWIKLGEYCMRCGEFALLPEYQKGLAS